MPFHIEIYYERDTLLYELNLSRDYVLQKVENYINNKNFFFYGRTIFPKRISRFLIFQSNQSFKNYFFMRLDSSEVTSEFITEPPVFQSSQKSEHLEVKNSHSSLTNEYLKEKDKYEKYLEKSKFVRTLEKLFPKVFAFNFLILFFLSLIEPNIESGILFEFFNSPLSIGAFLMIFITSGLGFVLTVTRLTKIQKECQYFNINFEYMYMYESLISYGKYLESTAIVDKNDTLLSLDKSLEKIKKWSYGNISFVYDKYKIYIDFIKKDFKSVIIYLININDINRMEEAKTLLLRFCEFLVNKDENKLILLYDVAIQYKQEEDILEEKIPPKDRMGIYIKDHQVISQLLFSGVLLIGIYYLGITMKANIKEIMPWLIAMFGISFIIFNWIKETVFQLDK